MITTLVWCERLLSLAIISQTLEFLDLKAIWSEQGIWRWSIVRRDYLSLPPKILLFLDYSLSEENFHRLLKLRMFCAILVWFIHPSLIIFILFLSTWLISIRWRGIFNGGSDSMTALIALALAIAQFFENHPIIVKACFAYIAVQLTGSYFLAGLAKVKNLEWRLGTALPIFFRTPRYDSPPAWIQSQMDQPKVAKFISWAVIVFELSFPLAWLHPQLCVLYLFLGFGFHLLNFWVFGLNRFVFAWLAAYPALYFWSQRA